VTKLKGENNMKTKVILQIVAMLALAFASMSLVNISHMEDRQDQKVEGKFELYRTAIKDAHQIDINGFKDRLKGGLADGKAITEYDLEELLTGIKFEMEHTSDGFIALEIAMDHLERIPDYYSRLCRLEREAVSDKLLRN
jgi:Protein of unknown function (DUF5661)